MTFAPGPLPAGTFTGELAITSNAENASSVVVPLTMRVGDDPILVDAEALTTGPAVSLGPDGEVRLPGTMQLNARLGYRWSLARGHVDASVRVDNATDALVLPQAGLPAPGREVHAGLRWSGWAGG